MKKVLFASAAVAAVFALSPLAFAGSISATTAINFTCSGQGVAGPGKEALPIGSGCTPFHSGSKTYEGLNSWSNVWYQEADNRQNRYEVQSLTGSSVNQGKPYVSAGNPGNGKFTSNVSTITYRSTNGFNYTGQNSATVSTLTSPTNIVPALGSSNLGDVKKLEITNNSDSFFFDGFFFGETTTNTTLSYMIFGYDGSNLVYCIDAAHNSCSGNLSSSWDHYTPSGTVGSNSMYYTRLSLPGNDAGTAVTRVYIDTQVPAGDIQYLDNFIVTETPEPDSLILLGTGFGLLGLMMFLRHRRTASQSTAV